MSHIHAMTQNARGTEAFAAIDFTSGYSQLSSKQDSQHLNASMTSDGVMQTIKTTQGGCTCVTCVETCYSVLWEYLFAWLDDFIIFHRTEDALLRVLQNFFELSLQKNVIVSLLKLTCFSKEIKWWGRKIDASKNILDPAKYARIYDANELHKAGELCQYVHGLTWMRFSIPRFS